MAHLAFAAEDRLDPLIGVFDFTDSSSAISLAQFVLRLGSHFEDIKRIASIEAVSSLTPFRWRSDTSDFKTQMGGPLEDRVASWTHQVHVQTASRYGFPSNGGPNFDRSSARPRRLLVLVLHRRCPIPSYLYFLRRWALRALTQFTKWT